MANLRYEKGTRQFQDTLASFLDKLLKKWQSLFRGSGKVFELLEFFSPLLDSIADAIAN